MAPVSSVFAVPAIVRNGLPYPANRSILQDMEDGNRFIEILTYGVIAFVVLAMIALLIQHPDSGSWIPLAHARGRVASLASNSALRNRAARGWKSPPVPELSVL